jgi:hypothetical protein
MKTNTKAVLAPILFLLIIGDIALNASVEYDPFAGGNRGQTGVLMYLAVQLMSQIMILYMMFLMLSHTYPFQAGLFKVVFKEFQWVFIGPTGFLLYFPLTLMLGIFRFVSQPLRNAPMQYVFNGIPTLILHPDTALFHPTTEYDNARESPLFTSQQHYLPTFINIPQTR